MRTGQKEKCSTYMLTRKKTKSEEGGGCAYNIFNQVYRSMAAICTYCNHTAQDRHVFPDLTCTLYSKGDGTGREIPHF